MAVHHTGNLGHSPPSMAAEAAGNTDRRLRIASMRCFRVRSSPRRNWARTPRRSFGSMCSEVFFRLAVDALLNAFVAVGVLFKISRRSTFLFVVAPTSFSPLNISFSTQRAIVRRHTRKSPASRAPFPLSPPSYQRP